MNRSSFSIHTSRWMCACLLLFSPLLFLPSHMCGQEASQHVPDPTTDQRFQRLLTGDWGGIRSSLETGGVSFGILARSDYGYNVSGGYHPGSGHILNVDLLAEVDGERLLGWEGTSALLHALYNNGGSLNRHVGDVQMVSNLEAMRTIKIYQLWLQQSFGEDALSALIGLYDLNAEFYVTPASSLFLNGSFGVGKEFSQTGTNGPSVFPNTALALRLRGNVEGGGYFQAAAIDATPGKPDDPVAPSFSVSTQDGLLIIGEGGQEGEANGHPFKLAIGGWIYTRKVQTLDAIAAATAPSRRAANWGSYMLSEVQLTRPSVASPGGLSLFARIGFTRGILNEYDYNASAGAVYKGVLSKQLSDQLGFAYSSAHRSLPLTSTATGEEEENAGAETVIELTYRFQPTQWLGIQLDYQRVLGPGSVPGLHDADVIGGRLELSL